jgi:hypothetical protein
MSDSMTADDEDVDAGGLTDAQHSWTAQFCGIDPKTSTTAPSDGQTDSDGGSVILAQSEGDGADAGQTGAHPDGGAPGDSQAQQTPAADDLAQPNQSVDPDAGQPNQCVDPDAGQSNQCVDPSAGQPNQSVNPDAGQANPAIKPLAPGDVVMVNGNSCVVFDDELRQGGTVSWRARNPGNIRSGDSYGAYPGKKLNTQSAGAFAIFPDEGTGMQAISAVLKGYGHVTVKQAMNKYAPSGDGANDPDQYARIVASRMGVTIDSFVDSLSDAQLSNFAEQIKTVEGWKAGTTYKRDDPKLPNDVRKRLNP